MENKVVTTNKGLYTDVPKNSQPEGTYSFALNAVDLSDEGEQYFIGNETGNTTAYSFPTGYLQIGHIPLINDDVIIFLGKIDGTGGEIGIGDKFGNYTTLINNDGFEWTFEDQVQGMLSIIDGCDRKIYFRAPKLWSINIDSLDQYLLAGETTTTANADGAGWDTDLMKWFPNYTIPVFDDISVNDNGGDLPMGTYQIITNYLDASLNEIGWMNMTLPIPIVNESYSGDYLLIDGGLNSLYPPSSKSISFSMSNVDTSFPYLRIAVVASNDNVRTGYKIIDLPITADTLDYTITTIQDTSITTVTLSELSIGKTIYEEAKTVNQSGNRALLGNVKEKNVNHAAFQQAANNITSHWFNKAVVDSSAIPNPKSPEIYLDLRGYMSDEVYAFGIVWQFPDGYETPVYHIPSRLVNTGYNGDVLPNYEPNVWHNRLAPTTTWDDSEYTVGTDIDEEEVKHLNLTTGDTVKRWQVFNTGIRFTTPATDYFAEGEFAYWEGDLSYPDTLDCNGVRIFPEGKIRHHKFPDATLVPYQTVDEETFTTYPLGARFENINIPTEYADLALTYKIVRIKRDKANSSVVDKGMFFRTWYAVTEDIFYQTSSYNGSRYGASVFYYNDPLMQTFHSLNTKFYRNSLGGTHIKLDQKIVAHPYDTGDYVDYVTSDGAAFGDYRSRIRFTGTDSDATYVPTITNRQVELQAYVDADTQLENVFTKTFDNTEQQEAFIIKTADSVPDPDTDETAMGGILTSSIVTAYYGGVKKYLPNQYGSISSGTYMSCMTNNISDTEADVYGGDTFITSIYFRRCARNLQVPVNHDEAYQYNNRELIRFFVESTINGYFRHEGLEDTEVYYPKTYLGAFDDFLELETLINGSLDTDLIPNYYAYNRDYSQESDVKVYFAIPNNFDYCSDCNTEFKTRVAYSEVKSTEGTQDSWIVFRANNYRDLPANKGDITNIFINNDKVYVHTEQSLFLMPTTQQTIQTDEAEIFLGNSQFFALDPVELKSIIEGYMGSNSQWATITTEYGTFFVSYDKLFLFSDTLAEISDLGMRQFFIDNKLQFLDSFRELLLSFNGLTLEFPNEDNPANPYGVGWITAFDRVKHRLIIHKRDFKILFGLGSVESPEGFWGVKNDLITYPDLAIVYDTDINWFTQYDSDDDVFRRLSFNNTDYFENKSLTISFDIKNKHWVSYHSYLPQYIFNTYSKWYSNDYTTLSGIGGVQVDTDVQSIIYTSDSWRHNDGEYQTFYNVVKPHIVELVFPQNILESQINKSLGYVSQARIFDTDYKQWKDVQNKTFDRIWLYNDTQSSGYLSCVVTNNNSNPYISINYSPTVAYLYKADKTWRLNSKRNLVSSTSTVPIATSRWTDVAASYYIDKLVNQDSLNTTQSQYNLQKFRDKYITMRLISDDPENHKLLTQYSYTLQTKSAR